MTTKLADSACTISLADLSVSSSSRESVGRRFPALAGACSLLLVLVAVWGRTRRPKIDQTFRYVVLHPLAVSLLALMACLPSLATTFTVTDRSDDVTDPNSLRYAVNNAGNGDTINFSLVAYPATITLDCADNGSLDIFTNNLTISGPGAANLAISGNNACNVFVVSPGVTATISGLTIEKGQAPSFFPYGGGIYNNHGTVTVRNSTLSMNSAVLGGGIYNDRGTVTVSATTLSVNSALGGGGIFGDGDTAVLNSTLSGNYNLASGGNGGGIFFENGTATVVNSTFSENASSGGIGGGIYNTTTLTVSNSTFSGNSASYGGGIFNAFATLTLGSTLLAGQTLGGDCYLDGGTAISHGYNLSDDSSCTFLTATGDQRDVTNAASYLGSPMNNGGPTQTFALLTGSTAIDAIPLSACTDVSGNLVTTDQRGISRPQGSRCDIGAYELTRVPTSNVCPNGQTTPTPCNYTITLQYNIPPGTTFGANPVKVVTQGAPNLDFTLASTTCAGSTNKCIVQVTFAPLEPGLRLGAVEVSDISGNPVAGNVIYGVGQSPAVAFIPGIQSTPVSGLDYPTGVAVDELGNFFVSDSSNAVWKIPPGCSNSSCEITVSSGLNGPYELALDGFDDVFIANDGNNQVVEVPSGCTSSACQLLVGSDVLHPLGEAVDGLGDVIIADTQNSRVVEIPAGCASESCQTPIGSGFVRPYSVAVDAGGDVFVADYSTNLVVEIPAGCTNASCQVTIGSGLTQPAGVAVDAAGDVFVAEYGASLVVEVPSGCTSSSCQITVGSGLSYPFQISLDGAGDAFIADYYNNRIVEVSRSQPPASLGFGCVQINSTSSPQTVTVQNIGNVALTFASIAASTNFVVDPGTTTCSTPSPLSLGQPCNVGVACSPHASGTLSGTLTLTDNALNGVNATQTIALSCTGIGAPTITSPNSATFTIGVSGSFTVTTTGSPVPGITEAGPLPNGLSFHDNGDGTGTLHGTPLVFDGGDFSIIFTAKNGIGSPATQAFTIILQQTPAISSANNATFTIRTPNSFGVTTTGFPSPSIAKSGALPAGVMFVDNHNGTGTLAGTPSVGGTFPIVLTATNGVTTTAQNFTLNVAGVSISPLNLNFGTTYLGNSITLSVTLTNMTASPIAITSVSITPGSANTAAYEAVSQCSSPLKAGKSCTVAVTFLANAPGLQTATLSVLDSTIASPQEVGLSAYVIDPVVQFNPPNLTFGTLAVHSSKTLPVQLTNSGQTPLDISGISVVGSDEFTEVNNCPAILSSAMSCTISVTFAPSVKGARTATLTVTDNVTAGQSTVALSGTGH